MIISADRLTKQFRTLRRKDGALGALATLFSRDYDVKDAVRDVSFQLDAGDLVGYIGPNGAGKSTTIKMLTGILVPTSGTCTVNGIVPWQDRQANGKQIGVVFGQRTQLYWDLPLIESFKLLRAIYNVPAAMYERNLAEFSEMLGLDEFIRTPVRQLSLGQRMRGDFAAAMLHEPKVVFLDEPTIGLDVVAKENIRQFIARVNRDRGTTFILTTHDLADIEKLCARIIIIDHGHKLYDGSVDTIKDRYGRSRVLTAELNCESCDDIVFDLRGAKIIERDGPRIVIEFDRDAVRADELVVELAKRHELKDVTIAEPSLEAIIRDFYQHGFDGAGAAPAFVERSQSQGVEVVS
ncbi:MAG: ATP-binding cassette domain-containing protein [Candidatus Eremiobacteraeota bacterium]|nr:ATP-binding cassette domain-containing protein [Candidatus Eremiobacteraeota bacterium]